MPNEIFDSSLRSAEDWAGVFEFDGTTAYFYLYNQAGEQEEKVAGAIHVLTGVPDFEQQDVLTRWDPTENKVGLFIRGDRGRPSIWRLAASTEGTTVPESGLISPMRSVQLSNDSFFHE
jgi:hypothetical protein